MHQEGPTRKKSSKKRTVVALACATGLVVLLVLVFARRTLVEQWHLWRLESSDRETRSEAMGALVQMRSSRATSRFAELTLKPEEDGSLQAMWSLLAYGCETWSVELRRIVVAAGQSETELVHRNFESFVFPLRDLTGKEVRSPETFEEACEILVRFKDLVERLK